LGEAGNDLIDAGGGDDLIYAGTGNDTIAAGEGADTVYGGAGNDLIYANAADGVADQIFGGSGADVIYAGGVVGIDADILRLGPAPVGGSKNVVITGADSNGNGFDSYVEFLDASGTAVSTLQFTEIETIVPCFIPSSRVETDRGPVLVELLRRGDRVLTKDKGFQPLVWVGHKTLTQQALAAASHLRPIRISAGALGARAPLQDVCVTSASHVDQW
jgi:hypothetical protein